MIQQNAALCAIGWAGIILLVDYCMWKGNILGGWRAMLERLDAYLRESMSALVEAKHVPIYLPALHLLVFWLTKILGNCLVCMGFWFGLLYLKRFGFAGYWTFLGVSGGIIVLYTIMIGVISKVK